MDQHLLTAETLTDPMFPNRRRNLPRTSTTTLSDAAELAASVLDCPRATLGWVDDAGNWVCERTGWAPEDPVDGRTFALEVSADNPVAVDEDAGGPGGICFVASAALFDGAGRPRGVLSVQDTRPRALSPEDRRWLGALARLTGAAMSAGDKQLPAEIGDRTEKLESLGALAGGIAHDFNNLLAVIQAYTSFTRETLAGDAEVDLDAVRADLDEVARAGEQAAALTRQLLSFSRMDAVSVDDVDPNQLASELQSILKTTVGEAIDLHLRCAATRGVSVDRPRFEQVLVNLAANARDAMPTGGDLFVEVADFSPELDCAPADLAERPYVRFTVRDTGIGMSSEVQERALEPFFTTKNRARGTGLGLASAYGTVRQLGGDITIRSAIGVGTKMDVFLPAVELRAPRARDCGGNEPTSGTGTVLVVEDDVGVRRLVGRILRTAGYDVLEAAGPDDALVACETYEGEIDVLLTDVVMPSMHGPQLARRATRLRSNANVLFMSGYPADRLVAYGVDPLEHGVLRKPFTAADLCDAVAGVIAGDGVPRR